VGDVDVNVNVVAWWRRRRRWWWWGRCSLRTWSASEYDFVFVLGWSSSATPRVFVSLSNYNLLLLNFTPSRRRRALWRGIVAVP